MSDQEIKIYQITPEGPVAGTIAPHEVSNAVASGQFVLPEKESVPVISPEGEHGTISAHEAEAAFKNGWQYATPEAIKEHKYGSATETLKAGLEGAAEGTLPFGLGTAAERALGANPEDIRGRREAHPLVHGAGQVAGLAASELIPGVGQANIINKATKTLGNPALKAGVQAALFQQGDELSKMISEDPTQSVGTAIAHIGLSGLLGGAAEKASSHIWEAASGSKLGGFLKGLAGDKGVQPASPKDPFKNVYIKGVDKEYVNKGEKFAKQIIEQSEKQADKLASAVGATAGHVVSPGLGTYLGHLVGEKALTPLMKSVLPGIAKALLGNEVDPGAAKSAINYAMDVVRGENAIGKAAKSLFEGTKTVLAGHLPDDKFLEKLDKKLQKFEANPSDLLNLGEHVSHYLPDHTTAISEAASNAVNYLNSKRPKAVQLSPLDKPQPPTAASKDAFNRSLGIAESPLSILAHIRQGTLLPEDVHDLRTLYPAVYNKLGQALTGSAVDYLTKGNHIPYVTRMSLSLFSGQHLDSSLTPQSIQSAQLTFLPKTPPAPPQGKSSASLSKDADTYRTPEQAREVHRSKS